VAALPAFQVRKEIRHATLERALQRGHAGELLVDEAPDFRG
jgi:hypothetical protein